MAEKITEMKEMENTVEKEENSKKVVFKTPYVFEQKEYTELDLSGLSKITAQDMIDAENMVNSTGEFVLVKEMAASYAFFMASRATGKPIEFFLRMPYAKAIKVKAKVRSFLGEEE